MLISWMGYALALSVCAAFVGTILDRLASIWALPRRWGWFVVLVTSVATLPVLAFRPAPAQTIAELNGASLRTLAESFYSQSVITAVGRLPWMAIAIAIWAFGTIACVALILRDAVRVTRRRSHWRPTYVDGVLVFLSNDDGPAVVGIRHPVIVLPAWTLGLSLDQRSLMLCHEREHLISGDYRLASAASLAVTLLPWCAGFWWIARRLRLAIEIDCDARVLGAATDPSEYGLLLIAVGARQSISLPFAMSLAEQRPLEERILAMTMVRPRQPAIASLPLAALAMLIVVAVALAPLPEPLTRTSHATALAVAPVAQHPAALVATGAPPRSSTRTAEPSHPHRVIRAESSRTAARSEAGTIAGSQTTLFVPRSIDGLATTAGIDAAPFSMVGDLTVDGVTRPVKWVGSARSKGDTVHGTARAAFTFEAFGLVSPRMAMLPSGRDTIRLEYEFDLVTVRH